MKTKSALPKPQHHTGRLAADLDVPTSHPHGHFLRRTTYPNGPIALIPAGTGAEGPEPQRANTRRLAECWNACRGINPKALPALLKLLGAILKEPSKARWVVADFESLDKAAAAVLAK